MSLSITTVLITIANEQSLVRGPGSNGAASSSYIFVISAQWGVGNGCFTVTYGAEMYESFCISNHYRNLISCFLFMLIPLLMHLGDQRANYPTISSGYRVVTSLYLG